MKLAHKRSKQTSCCPHCECRLSHADIKRMLHKFAKDKLKRRGLGHVSITYHYNRRTKKYDYSFGRCSIKDEERADKILIRAAKAATRNGG